jgi:hypothetical protein
MATNSEQLSTQISFRDIVDDGVGACIAYVIKFIFGGTFPGIMLILIGVQLQHSTVGHAASLLGAFWTTLSFWRRGFLATVSALVLAALAYAAAEFAIRGLATMATNGVYGPDESGRTSYYVGNYLVFGILWLIFGVPYRAFKYKIDINGEGKSQDVITTTMAVISALLTGAFIIFLHYDKGPFSQIDIKALVVGGIFTIFLLVPIYRTIAKTCWQHGVIGMFSVRSFLSRWRDAAIEIDATKLEYYTELYSRERQERQAKHSSAVKDDDKVDRHQKPTQSPKGPHVPHQGNSKQVNSSRSGSNTRRKRPQSGRMKSRKRR